MVVCLVLCETQISQNGIKSKDFSALTKNKLECKMATFNEH